MGNVFYTYCRDLWDIISRDPSDILLTETYGIPYQKTHDIIIIKVFIKRNILSVETSLSAYTQTSTQTHEHTDHTELNLRTIHHSPQIADHTTTR